MTKKIITITGPSGSGKTTLIERVFKPEQVLRSVTTRPMRPGEINGENYIFISEKEYQQLLTNNQLTQKAEYDHHYYGMTKTEILTKLEKYDTVVIAIVMSSVNDFIAFGKQYNIEVIPVFTSISHETLLKHFQQRLESEQDKQRRIAQFETEIANQKYFDSNHILDMNPNDFGESAAIALQKLINRTS